MPSNMIGKFEIGWPEAEWTSETQVCFIW